MIKIYTPEQWLTIFGDHPSLIIKDNGEIYSAEDYYKVVEGPPIGQVDFEKGRIYGKDYASLSRVPIGYLEKTTDVIKVYDRVPGLLAAPILYIQGDKVYTPEQYTSIFGSDAAGYIKRKEKTPSVEAGGDHTPPSPSTDSAGGLGGLGGSLLKLGGILLAAYCVIGGVGAGLAAALPIWALIILALLLPAGLGYMAFFAPKSEKTKAFKVGFYAVLIWYGICGLIFLKYL